MLPSDEVTWLAVFDTRKYAGGCVRDLAAWVGGLTWDGDTNYVLVNAARLAIPNEVSEWLEARCWFDDDDEGGALLWPTPGMFNDGYGHIWCDDADPELVRRGFEEGVRSNKYMGAAARDAMLARGSVRHPAYCSVALLLKAEPPESVVLTLRQRALTFQGAKVGGFRLLRRQVTYEDVLVPDVLDTAFVKEVAG